MKLGQHHRIAAIGLHPVARLDWDRRRSHHNAFMPTAGQQPVQPITTRAGLVAKAQPTTPFAQPGCQLHQNLGTVLENSDLAHVTVAAALGMRDAERRLVHIQSVVGDSYPSGPSPMHGALCRSPGASLDILHVERRAADHSANIGSRAKIETSDASE